MRAMILAAGYGTRLWPLTIDRAKPALPLLGKPLVGYVAEYLAQYGCRDICVNLHHRPESVRAALGDGSRFGARLYFIEEPEILGTSGALDNARALLEDDTFIVINGKIATDINLQQALETHRRAEALATLVLRPNPLRERYSIVEVRDDLIIGFGKYPASDNVGGATIVSANHEDETARNAVGAVSASGRGHREHDIDSAAPLMFTGIQILESRIFEYIPRGVFSHTTTDVYPKAMLRGERIVAHIADGMWHELSTIQRYLDTNLDLLKQRGRDVELGEGSHIERGAEVNQTVLWEGVYIESGARVQRAVLGAGVRVPQGETFENVAVVRAELVQGSVRPEKALAGELRGDNFVVPLAQ